MALRVGLVEPFFEAAGPIRDYGQPRTLNGPACGEIRQSYDVWLAINNRLRTGTDKGNPTV